MIDLYFWPTGNGKKISIMLEECELEYRVIPVNINKGDQFSAEYVAISPNSKMPAIVDHDVSGPPLAMFESGAILQYLAEKTGRFLPQDDTREKYRVLQWLFWQIGGLGPMGGQAHHFLKYSPQKIDYAMERFRNEMARLYKVLDQQLQFNDYVAGDYSIADMAIWPWVFRHEWQQQDLNDFPYVKLWFEMVGNRPAVQKGANVGKDFMGANQQMTKEDKMRLFNLREEHFQDQ